MLQQTSKILRSFKQREQILLSKKPQEELAQTEPELWVHLKTLLLLVQAVSHSNLNQHNQASQPHNNKLLPQLQLLHLKQPMLKLEDT